MPEAQSVLPDSSGTKPVCIIPARGGSKRLPRKNIRDFHGKPMISYPITVAIHSRLFSRVIVSTDDTEIAEVAKNYGAEVPFIRPDELSRDDTPTRPVIRHAIQHLRLTSCDFEQICVVYPSTPLLEASDLRSAFRILNQNRLDFVFSAKFYSHPIQRALRFTAEGGVEMVQEIFSKSRTQDLSRTFHDAGQFYWGTVTEFQSEASPYRGRVAPFFLPPWKAVDIDTPDDLELASRLFSVEGVTRSELDHGV